MVTLLSIVLDWMIRNWLPLGFVAVLTAGYSTLAIHLHVRVQTAGYDLGTFEQATRNDAWWRAPVVDLKGSGFNLLGDHFHPIIATLASFFSAFPSPITLLAAQVFLFALASVPLVDWARRALGTVSAVIVGCL